MQIDKNREPPCSYSIFLCVLCFIYVQQTHVWFFFRRWDLASIQSIYIYLLICIDALVAFSFGSACACVRFCDGFWITIGINWETNSMSEWERWKQIKNYIYRITNKHIISIADDIFVGICLETHCEELNELEYMQIKWPIFWYSIEVDLGINLEATELLEICIGLWKMNWFGHTRMAPFTSYSWFYQLKDLKKHY